MPLTAPPMREAWITCCGPRRDLREGQCGKKLARLLEDGRFEIIIKNFHGHFFTIYVCSGVTRVDCPSCGTPCLLMCIV